MKSSVLLFLSAFICLSATRCGSPGNKGNVPKWENYNERLESEERLSRKQAGLRARSILTPTDTPGKMQVAGMDSFDTEGHMVISRIFDETGHVAKEQLNNYQNGRLVSTVLLDERGPITNHFVYDSKGLKTNEYIIDALGDTVMTRKYKYNEDGDEVWAEFWRRENNLRAVKETQYDELRRPFAVKEYEGDTLTWEEKYVHVSKERLEASRMDNKGEVLRRFIMVFDSTGNCTAMEQYNKAGLRGVLVRRTYDARGNNVKEENVGSNDQVLESTEFEYDAKRMRTKVRATSRGGTQELYYENRFYQQ